MMFKGWTHFGNDLKVTVKVRQSEEKTGVCRTCGRPTRRSPYGCLHLDCFRCRYLKMIYGPNIRVERF